MESSPELFALEFTPSDEELEPQSARFNIADLPNLNIPSPLQSDSSDCETPTSSCRYSTSRPSTPTTPVSSPSALGSVFSYIELSGSQNSDGQFATRKTTRGKKYVIKCRVDSENGSHNFTIHR